MPILATTATTTTSVF